MSLNSPECTMRAHWDSPLGSDGAHHPWFWKGSPDVYHIQCSLLSVCHRLELIVPGIVLQRPIQISVPLLNHTRKGNAISFPSLAWAKSLNLSFYGHCGFENQNALHFKKAKNSISLRMKRSPLRKQHSSLQNLLIVPRCKKLIGKKILWKWSNLNITAVGVIL